MQTAERKCLKEFKLEWIPKFASIVLIGSTGSGKTSLMKALMENAHRHHKIPQCKMFSGTEHLNKNFHGILPAAAIERGMPLKRVEQFVHEAQKEVEQARETRPRDLEKGVYDRILISDDAMPGSKSVTHSDIFEQIFFNGRHFKTTAWIASQDAKKIPTFARNNSEYAFIFFHGSPYDQKFLFDHYSTHIPTFSMFRELMELYCQDYTCLVFHHRTRSNRLEDAVFYYKAPIIADFKFGHPGWWRAANQLEMISPTASPSVSSAATVKVSPNVVKFKVAKQMKKEEEVKRQEEEFVQLAIKGLREYESKQNGLQASDPELL